MENPSQDSSAACPWVRASPTPIISTRGPFAAASKIGSGLSRICELCDEYAVDTVCGVCDMYCVYGVYGTSEVLSEMSFVLRLLNISTAQAANIIPPRTKAAMMIPALAPLDRFGFGQVEVTASGIPVAPASCVPVTFSVVSSVVLRVALIVVVTVVVGIVDVVSATLVVDRATSTPTSLHAALI